MRVVFRNVPEFLAELGKQPIEGKILRLTTRNEKTGTAKFLIYRVTIATCLVEGVGDLLKLSVQEEPEKAVAAQQVEAFAKEAGLDLRGGIIDDGLDEEA